MEAHIFAQRELFVRARHATNTIDTREVGRCSVRHHHCLNSTRPHASPVQIQITVNDWICNKNSAIQKKVFMMKHLLMKEVV